MTTRLIADIGGTNARFALADEKGISQVRVLSCDAYDTLAAAARSYLDEVGAAPQTGAFAVACPVDGGDTVDMVNHHWRFSVRETGAALGLHSLRILNDFGALAWAAPYLSQGDLRQVGEGAPQKDKPIAIIGPGTGLGVAAVVFADGKPIPLATEGGHVTMPASTPREFALFHYLRETKYSHVSAERVASGKGLVNLYHAIAGVDGLTLPEKTPAEITRAALDKTCAASAEALDLFCHFLGVVAGNLALSYGAFGGVYIAGGIVPQLGSAFDASRFRESFLSKGRFRDYLAPIPTLVITHPYPGLEGLRRAA